MIGTSGVVTRDKRDKRGCAVLSGWLDPPQGIVINLGGIAVTISRSHDTSVDALRCGKEESYLVQEEKVSFLVTAVLTVELQPHNSTNASGTGWQFDTSITLISR
ncbi:hypothetical protein ACKS0A_03807 [Histoplasma ohiense]